MTVTSAVSKNTYSGDGADTTFSFTFEILDESHILVQLESSAGVITTQTITTDYTVSGMGNTTGATDFTSGTITFVTAPGATDTVILLRNVPLTQATDYVENDAFPAETHEDALDKLTMINQQQTEELDRALTITPSFTSAIILPTPVANTYLKWNSAADNIEYDTLAGSGGITAIVQDTTPQYGGNMDQNANLLFNNLSNVTLADGTDVTKKLAINMSGATTAKTVTLISSHTDNRSITLPNATDTLVGKATTDTLTNKTLTSPVLNTAISGTAFLDEDTLSSNSATKVASQQSIKAYVDNKAATQAEQETGSSSSVYVTPAVQENHSSAAKGWVNFNGTGTLAIGTSYNVTGVADNGTGDYTITWATDFSSADYTVVMSCGVNTEVRSAIPISLAAGTTQFFTQNSSHVSADASIVSVVGYGDQ